MVVPTKYRTSPELAVSYDYVDVAEGTGILTLYGVASTVSGATVSRHLVGNSNVWSEPAGTTKGSTIGEDIYNFDLAPFNLPRYAKGTANFSAGIGVNNSGKASLRVQIKHLRGITETNLTEEAISQELTNPTAASEMVFLELPITTEKLFQIGDILRLTVTLIQAEGAGGAIVGFGHDPANQPAANIVPSTADTTIMLLNMPFRIDI